jgi:ribosomal protein S18 acetylase RimI-like enzyme
MSQDFIFLNNNTIEEFYYIFNDAFNDDIYNKTIDLESFKENLTNLNINNNISFLIREDKKNIGLFLGTIKGNTGYISSMRVSKQFRKMGYGQILLEKGISIMEDHDCKKIILEVKDDNKNAINLYLKSGFKITNTINNYKYESNLIFTDVIEESYKLQEEDSFKYQLLYNTFHKSRLPWHKTFNTIYEKINAKKSQLFSLHYDNLTVGYIAITVNNNIINFEDIGIKNTEINILKLLFSLTLQKTIDISSQNEILLLANNYYKNDPLCSLLENIGFYIYIIQYQMEKRLA